MSKDKDSEDSEEAEGQKKDDFYMRLPASSDRIIADRNLFAVVYCINRVYFLVIYSHFFFSTLYAIRHNQEKNGKGLRFYRC